MKILTIGDPHVTVSNLKESELLMDFAIDTAIKEDVNAISFLGDQFHTHAVVRVEVIDFWKNVFKKIKDAQIDCRVLVGNHDQPGSKEKEQLMNSLNVFQEQEEEGGWRTIINKPMIFNNIAYIPYMSDKEAFLKASADLHANGAAKLLIAHQTFTGATYENGFYAEDGIDPALVHQENIVSGHIHKQQQLGKCFYPGTPKWDTMSDANENKGIWIFEHNKDGSVKDKKFISTEKIVTPIYRHTYEEGGDAPKLIEGARNYLELLGKSAWITKMKNKYKGKANIKARPTDRKSVKIDKEGVLSLSHYIDKYWEAIDGVDKNEVKEYLEGLSG